MRTLLLAAVIAGSIAPAAVLAQTSSGPTAAQYAEQMHGAVGQKFNSDLTLQNIAAEGNTLVLTITGPAGWRGTLSPNEVSTALVAGFCESAPKFFDGGIKLRVDSIDGGTLLAGSPVAACPAAKRD